MGPDRARRPLHDPGVAVVNIVADLLHLFRGNPAAVGLDDAGRGAPGPLRLDPDHAQGEWTILMERHLAGTIGIGVYPFNHAKDGVAWGCVDLDEGELASWSLATDLRMGLHELGVTGFIERSRSKGYHVWVFFGGWVPAPLVRRLLVGTCQAVGAPTREVNPKSEALQPGQLGNFVRLPYKGTERPMRPPPSSARQVVVDALGTPMSAGLFTATALDAALDVHELSRAAKRVHVQPEPTQRPLRSIYTGPWRDQLNPLAKVELERGPKPGQDRSSFLSAFAHACQESGLTEDDADAAVRLADYLHGQKYSDRKDADNRYHDLVAHTYQEGA